MFEFLFKYPRSVYARGQFALLGAWPKWMLVLAILAAAVGLAWLIRSRLAQAAPVMRGWRVWIIWRDVYKRQIECRPAKVRQCASPGGS